ncbi:hypothetical protein P4O66_018373 [Electrophorus voltai]|uniref:Tetraspanin-4 n=1 Tax=Electrophorus voltai TaxID=2609070 RepID=A0AAD9DL93_9TELE|nr:hypothetical protein P4O66_018373 [Electrophorus voltai]
MQLPHFTEYTTAETAGPEHLILELDPGLLDWATSVQIGSSISSTTTLSTGVPQGSVLSPLLFTLLIHKYAATHSLNHIIKFTDDMTMVGLISRDDESAYREVQWLMDGCKDKTKEMVVDFRKVRGDHSPLNIDNSSDRENPEQLHHCLVWELHYLRLRSALVTTAVQSVTVRIYQGCLNGETLCPSGWSRPGGVSEVAFMVHSGAVLGEQFFILLLVIFLLEILSIILCFAYQNQIDQYAQSDLKKGLQLFGTEGNIGLTNAWSIVQTDFRCCGVTNHTDWFEVYNATRVPDSCCLEYSDNCGLENPGTWWTAPCYERVKGWLQENLVALWIFALCTALTQILGLVFSMTLFCQAVKVETFYA